MIKVHHRLPKSITVYINDGGFFEWPSALALITIAPKLLIGCAIKKAKLYFVVALVAIVLPKSIITIEFITC